MDIPEDPWPWRGSVNEYVEGQKIDANIQLNSWESLKPAIDALDYQDLVLILIYLSKKHSSGELASSPQYNLGHITVTGILAHLQGDANLGLSASRLTPEILQEIIYAIDALSKNDEDNLYWYIQSKIYEKLKEQK